jgi:hypothetical protein
MQQKVIVTLILHSRLLLEVGSTRRKAATYKQNNTDTE